MTGREIIKRVIEFKNPERIGYDFSPPHPSDMVGAEVSTGKATKWGRDPEILKLVPEFEGEVYRDEYGNIWGRLENITKGEVIRGVLEDGWEGLDDYQLPDYSPIELYQPAKARFEAYPDKYRLGGLPGFPFAIMRYMRRMENFLMDVLLHKEEVLRLNDMVVDMLLKVIDNYAAIGADGVTFAEDWGTQDRLLISPKMWRELFKPSFEVLVGRAHSHGMHVLMHSCGYIYDIIPDLIEVGIDALQLDQPELMGVERLGEDFGGKITFWSPVDIQKVMQTGDEHLIKEEAKKMIYYFGRYGGGFIAKDYPQWDAIGVRPEWAQWARDAFMEFGHSYYEIKYS